MRRRYVLRNGELVEKNSPAAYSNIMPDIAEFKTQDGTPITSRSHLREYEKRMGVKQIGTDWAGSERPPFWDMHMDRQRNGKIGRVKPGD